MIAATVIVAWSVLCLIYASTQSGFSVVAYVAWILGAVAVLLFSSWRDMHG